MNLDKYRQYFYQSYLEQKTPRIHTKQTKEGHQTMPFFVMDEELRNFERDFYESAFLDPNYKFFFDEKGIQVEEIKDFSTFQKKELKAILTYILRKNRFVEGFLSRKILDGSIYKILEELINREKE